MGFVVVEPTEEQILEGLIEVYGQREAYGSKLRVGHIVTLRKRLRLAGSSEDDLVTDQGGRQVVVTPELLAKILLRVNE